VGSGADPVSGLPAIPGPTAVFTIGPALVSTGRMLPMAANRMPASDAVRILDLLDRAGVAAVVDGGWGVDALLGRQTREHGDLDLAIPLGQEQQARAALSADGFEQRDEPGASAHNFVVERRMAAVDIHLYAFDGDEPVAPIGIAYPRASLVGTGSIAGRAVVCIAPEWVLRFHTGYPLDADDLADVRAIAGAFGLPLLPEQRR
jgi:lincosamide nucleotidyltransferase A/C/D/E